MKEEFEISKKTDVERMLLQRLDEIVQRLDLLVELSIPSPKTQTVRLSKLEQAVYALCDMQHDRKEVARILGKSPNLVSVTLDALKKKGLVRSMSVAGRTCYLRLRG